MLAAVNNHVELNNLPELWLQVLNLLEPINTSACLGRTVPEAFSTKIQRRLASTVPPRPIVNLSFEDAFAQMKHMCQDCVETTRLLTISDAGPMDPQECIVCRSECLQ